MSTTPQPTRPTQRNPVRDLSLLLLALVAVAGGVLAFFYYTEMGGIPDVDFARSVRASISNPDKLDPEYTDADGDLVADPPSDAAKQLDPEVLLFCPLENDLEKAKAEWKEFTEHLAKATGKKVEVVLPTGMKRGGVGMMKEGQAHLAALSTGAVPMGVNAAGFVPCCVMADENGNYAYQMEVLVPTKGPAKALADLKGKTLTLGSTSSLSSFKAPIIVLWKEQRLRPGTDYKVSIASGGREMVRLLADGEADAIAIPNDFLARIIRDEKIDPKAFRTIYKSESFPPACFGYVNTLKPELGKKIKEAFLSFDWKGTALEKAYRPANQVKFVAADYKKDWAPVREVDKAILELVGKE